jgi:hypothetical protein
MIAGAPLKKLPTVFDNRQLEGFQPLSSGSTGFKSNS